VTTPYGTGRKNCLRWRLSLRPSNETINQDKKKLGICKAPIPLLALGAESRVVTRVTRQTGKLNEERSRTTTSRSQQQIRTESKFTATAGIRTRDYRDAGAPF
jgi:hypothetical protein